MALQLKPGSHAVQTKPGIVSSSVYMPAAQTHSKTSMTTESSLLVMIDGFYL